MVVHFASPTLAAKAAAKVGHPGFARMIAVVRDEQLIGQGTDVFVIGGGPAGLAAAIAAAQKGLAVTVADSARPPIDKACGEGIMPDGVLALGGLGVDLTGVAAAPFEGIRFVDGAGESGARFVHGAGFGVRRVALHGALTARAEAVGVRLLWGTRVEAVREGEVVAGGRTLRGRYVVCADGQNSSLRQMVGLGAGKVYRRRYGFRSHYKVRPWSRFVEVHWADCGQAYVTPVGDEDVCVTLITSEPHLRMEDVLPSFPELRARLAGQRPSDRAVGGVTVTRRLKAVTRGRVALVGDSAGSADAITGDGLSLAFQEAAALADAMCSGDLGGYQRRHDQISTWPRNMGRLMLAADDHPRLRRRIFGALAQSPGMFEKLLAVHTRKISPLQLGVRECLAFGWDVLRARECVDG
jgi:flavin-dependent dehydrogenase